MSISALADKLGLAKRAAARIQREVDNELEKINALMEAGIWSEEDPTRRNELEALLRANEKRLELLTEVVANREALQAQYLQLTKPRPVTLEEFRRSR